MTVIINNINSNVPKVFLPFCQDNNKTKRTFRYHNRVKSDSYTQTKAFLGASVGALSAIAVIAKMQRVRPWKLDYKLPEFIGLATTSIVGGVIGGSIGATEEDKKEKRNEGLFQFLNSSIPALLVSGGLYLAQKSMKYNNTAVKAAVSFIGILMGMQLASNITNKVIDPNNKVPDRKLGFKDALANMDDALGVVVMMKPKKAPNVKPNFLEKYNILENVLPVVMAWCGYRAGQTN